MLDQDPMQSLKWEHILTCMITNRMEQIPLEQMLDIITVSTWYQHRNFLTKKFVEVYCYYQLVHVGGYFSGIEVFLVPSKCLSKYCATEITRVLTETSCQIV